jgi:hypothetical protein
VLGAREEMNKHHGALVSPVVEQLGPLIESSGPLRVYYDHAGKEPQRLQAFVGREPHLQNCFAWVDILVANADTCQAELVIEIEETGADPKKILGDVMAVVLSESVAARDVCTGQHRCYHITPQTELWVCFPTEPKGYQRERNKLLQGRLEDTLGASSCFPHIKMITCDARDELVDAIGAAVKDWFQKKIKGQAIS